MKKPENFEEEAKMNTFEYKGRFYRLAHEGGIVIAIDKSRLPETLTRVVSDAPMAYDENGIMRPKSDNNDMVSLASPDEWEKFARMFNFGKEFKVVTVKTENIIGPTFLAGNRILLNGEILALVPRDAILEEQRYTWQTAEDNYDYKEDSYTDDYDRDFYQRLVVNRTLGFKPKKL